MLRRLFIGFATFGLILPLVACDPCRDLAEKICDCRDEQSDRDMCKQRLDQYPKLRGFSWAEDQERCRAILQDKDCNCPAIHAQNYEKCGLTR